MYRPVGANCGHGSKVLSDAYISSAPVLTGNDSGFYHLLGVLAIIIGVISLILVAILAMPKNRTTRKFLQRDPFDDSWKRQQATFMEQVMKAEPDTLTDTLIPGVVPVSLPPETGRPTVTIRPITGVVVDEIPDDDPQDEGDRILAQIREDNKKFLASWSA